MPKLDESEVIEMMSNPGLTKSDSFYFVEGQLIMHNKASYSYVEANDGDRKMAATATVSANTDSSAASQQPATASSANSSSTSTRPPATDPAATSKKDSPTKKK